MTKSKHSDNPNASKNVEKLDHLYIAGGSLKWSSYSGKQFIGFLKTKHVTALQPSNCAPGHFIPKKWKLNVHKKTCAQMFIGESQVI